MFSLAGVYCGLLEKVAQTVKASGYNARDLGSTPGSGRYTGEGNGNPFPPVRLSGRSHGQKSLADYSPWDHKESDITG